VPQTNALDGGEENYCFEVDLRGRKNSDAPATTALNDDGN
jgi:hypothetical protein